MNSLPWVLTEDVHCLQVCKEVQWAHLWYSPRTSAFAEVWSINLLLEIVLLDGFLGEVFLGKRSTKAVQLSVKTRLGNDMLFGTKTVGKKLRIVLWCICTRTINFGWKGCLNYKEFSNFWLFSFKTFMSLTEFLISFKCDKKVCLHKNTWLIQNPTRN